MALLPTIALLAADPKAFFFDNFAANGVLNLRFRWASMPERASSLDKVFFLAGLLLTSPSNLLLLTGFVVFACWLPLRGGWRMAFSSPESVAILLIVPFTLLGAILPTPSYRQYYSMVVPFLFLGTAFGLARFWNTTAAEGKLSRLLFWGLIASFLEAISNLYGSGVATRPDRWAIWSIHRAGLEIQRQAGPGPILTLAPIYPLEGRSPIYQQLCTGPFAWRLSPFATEKDRSHYQFIGPDNFDSHLTIKPGAILTHADEADSDLEAPLIRYARDNAFAMIRLADGSVLWVRQRAR